uniref:RING-CH-type domain-containing protein n=1 Tax=Ditylenchus dipsaci TaxID=166011 RepID=A0A915EEY6_9BILA
MQSNFSPNPDNLLLGLRDQNCTTPLVDIPATIIPEASGPQFLEQQCRYCHVVNNTTTTSSKKALVAPCRCAGTVQFVHTACLTRWIEVSSRKLYPTPRCELCGYKYRRRPFIDALQRQQQTALIRPSRSNKRFLTENDVTVIIASILFFAAFS